MTNNIHPLTRLSKKEALLFAAVCDMYADGEETALAVDDRGDLYLQCKEGTFTIWHGHLMLEDKERI
jgi:hypothetical protein